MIAPVGLGSVCGGVGEGKSVSVKRILLGCPQVILHAEFRGERIGLTQIAWLYLSMPPKASAYGLLKHIASILDHVLSTDYCREVDAALHNTDRTSIVASKLAAKFAAVLEQKLADIEQASIRAHLTDENFTDLLEESIRQAARSVTDERRTYIASVIAEGIATDSVEFIESKHLLRILGEINDIEVLWLRSHLVATMGGDEEFRQKHSDIFNVQPAVIGGPQDIRDKNAMKDSYLQHLAQLGLLSPVYHTDRRTKQPEIDTFTGAPKLRHYRLTGLGGLLLRHINLTVNETVA